MQNAKKSQTQEPSTSTSQENLKEAAAAPPSHQMEHRGVICDICSTKVCGFRFKCTQCPDFDLCHACEIKGHHVGHILMRIPFPEQSADAIRRLYGKENAEGAFPTHHRRSFGHNRGFKCGTSMWEKIMKDAAEQYGQCAAQAEMNTNANSSDKSTPETPFDFTAASLQLQELLNAWGVPINVSEMCSQFGFEGIPNPTEAKDSTGEKSSTTQKSTENTENNSQGVENEKMDHSGKSDPQPSTSKTIPTPAGDSTAHPLPPLSAIFQNALQNPQIQQLIQHVATAAENASGNIPSTSSSSSPAPTWRDILTQLNTNISTENSDANKKQQEEINASTLNHLLSMGFSNEDNWLTSLVTAKKGNLEAVLNSLSPPVASTA